MKFLLELMSCCSGSAFSVPPSEPPQPDSPPSKRRRTVAEWQPSLSSISENTIAPEMSHRTTAAEFSEQMVKKKVGSTAPARIRTSSYADDFGRGGFQAIIPAFSPAPFLF